MSNEKKIVRASDANIFKRMAKKYTGQVYPEDMTDAQLQALLDKPNSVFGKAKAQALVGRERSRRKALTKKAYDDAPLREAVREARNKRLGIETMVENARKFNKANKARGGAVMKARGGTFKGTF